MSVYRTITEGSVWGSRYVLMLTLSTVIAAFGLLANSTAVVIGAMIIAPLMGPILGLSMGMVSGSTDLQRKSGLSEAVGVLVCVGIAFGIGKFTVSVGASSEMMARTAPTTFDLAVALASGLAGAYASVNTKVNSALAGVAISVALVPPLATCGLFLAFGQTELGLGALLLWFANFVAIQLAAAGVFALYGFIRSEMTQNGGAIKVVLRFAPSLVALVLVGWFLTTTLVRLVAERSQDNEIRSVLFDQVAKRTGGRLESVLQVERDREGVRIVASALTPQPFEAEQVAQIEAELSRRVNAKVSLVLRSLVSVDMGAKGRVYVSDSELERQSDASKQAEFLESARRIIKEALEGHQAAEVVEVERRDENGIAVLTTVVRAPEPILPQEVAAAEDRLAQDLGQPVHLIVRSISTQDADRSGNLYTGKPDELDVDLDNLRARIGAILGRRLSGLKDYSVSRSAETVNVQAMVEVEGFPNRADAEALESDLRKNVDPRIRLSVRFEFVIRGSGQGAEPALPPGT